MGISFSVYQILTSIAIPPEKPAQRPEEPELCIRNPRPVTYSGLTRISSPRSSRV